jgi:HPt (histidine-containing phosphotransfer) domain-containing protein
LENGFTGFLSKPIDITELDMLLKKWLPKNKRADADGDNEPRGKAAKHDEVLNVSIKGVNSEKGIRETGGTIRNYMKMLAVFYDEGTKKLSDIEASFESKNIGLYTTCVHGLKSSLSIIGAEKLSGDAKNLESAGKQGDFDYIQDHNSEFLMNLKSLLESIDEVISKDAPDTGGGAPDADFLIRTLTEFKEALENFDSAGIGKAVDILQGYTRMPDAGDSIQNILNNRLIGEHEAAVDGIEALINSKKARQTGFIHANQKTPS